MRILDHRSDYILIDGGNGATPGELLKMEQAVRAVYEELFPNRNFRTYPSNDRSFRVIDTKRNTGGHKPIACSIRRRYVHFEGRMAERAKSDFMKRMGLAGEAEPVVCIAAAPVYVQQEFSPPPELPL
jgi:hypothetical protein